MKKLFVYSAAALFLGGMVVSCNKTAQNVEESVDSLAVDSVLVEDTLAVDSVVSEDTVAVVEEAVAEVKTEAKKAVKKAAVRKKK